MADNDSLRMYPRGFLGGNLEAQIERTPKAFGNPIANTQYHVNDHKSAADILPNSHVEDLYSSYIRQTASMGDFEFRKKLLKVALVSFGTDRFDMWYQSQFQSPAIGDLHSRFLVDTIKFISSGKRDMSLETWGALLIITDEGDRVKGMTKDAKEFFGISADGVTRHPRNRSIIEIIQSWCSQPNGSEDLLGTLHILFGTA